MHRSISVHTCSVEMHEYDEGATDYNPIIDQMTKVRV